MLRALRSESVEVLKECLSQEDSSKMAHLPQRGDMLNYCIRDTELTSSSCQGPLAQ